MNMSEKQEEAVVEVEYNDGISCSAGWPPKFGFIVKFEEELGSRLPIEAVEKRLEDIFKFAMKRIAEAREKRHLENISGTQ
jgi:hypothetical protein